MESYKGLLKKIGYAGAAFAMVGMLSSRCSNVIQRFEDEEVTGLARSIECHDGKDGYSREDVDDFFDRLVDIKCAYGKASFGMGFGVDKNRQRKDLADAWIQMGDLGKLHEKPTEYFAPRNLHGRFFPSDLEEFIRSYNLNP
ncbi:hypothetical protein HZB02_03200 [Candidatus Woesearchaeota archaeon]|nr:hypothetical protein [Candidatus Woesearchaeota archaeon]